jgi:DNA-binding GntR family transcriptional regulator
MTDLTDVEYAESKTGARPTLVSTRDVHDVVRQHILDGTLEPGLVISQLELGRRLSVSRTPLREALKLLEREGLVVDTGPHKLVKISPLTMRDLDDLYSLRVLGEGLAIWLTVPTLKDSDFEQLAKCLEITRSNTADRPTRAAAHRRLHAGLRVGGGLRLCQHLSVLFEHAERYQRAFVAGRSTAVQGKWHEHDAILEACTARDRQLARTLLVNHVASTAMDLMTAERHAPFSLPVAVEMATAGARSPMH